jgi:hypothetical protein
VPPEVRPVKEPPAASAMVKVATVFPADGRATETPLPIWTASKPLMLAPVVVVRTA